MCKRIKMSLVWILAVSVLGGCGQSNDRMVDESVENEIMAEIDKLPTDVIPDDWDAADGENTDADVSDGDAADGEGADGDAADGKEAGGDSEDVSVRGAGEGDNPMQDENVQVYYYDYTTVYDGDRYDVTELLHRVDGTFEIAEGKTLDGLCDYAETTALEEGKHINRNLLYDLVECAIKDSSLHEEKIDSIVGVLHFYMSIANEFESIGGMRVRNVILDKEDLSQVKYTMAIDGADDNIFILNPTERTFFMNDGKTEYESSMLTDETLGIWRYVIDEYIGQ